MPGNSRGQNRNIRCQRCWLEKNKETPSHVLGICPYGEDRRIARHHSVKYRINALLTAKGFACYDEVECIDGNNRNRYVDILAFAPNSNKAYIIDPTIRFETNADLDTIVQREKEDRYQSCISDLSLQYAHMGQRDYEVLGVWFGSRGTIGRTALELFEKFNLDKRELPDIAESILVASLQMIHYHIYG